tara:strand:+ start:4191 stop:4856 length:666 start_codon:yes stop_codon:yes gene_type:complete
MATSTYMTGRKKYSRPQAMLLSENPGTLQVLNQGTVSEELFYIPDGYEIGADIPAGSDISLESQFLILSDHNREALDFKIERLEKRERMINGRMRSYHIADKLSLSVSWSMLPSRSYPGVSNFSTITGKATDYDYTAEYTVDNGAGGVELLDWYNSHTGSFWLFLSYDNYKNFGISETSFNQLTKYSQVVEVFISDFSYAVTKRGGNTYDFWNVSMTLEEV